jgi:YjbR
MWFVKGRSEDRSSAAVTVTEDIVERVSALCLALPEVTVRIDQPRTGTRSTAYSFDVRQRSFCLLVAVADPTGRAVPLLRLCADPDERQALLSIGHPFFAPRSGHGRIGVLLTGDTDWEELRELVTESYRVLAPKKLTALLDEGEQAVEPGAPREGQRQQGSSVSPLVPHHPTSH